MASRGVMLSSSCSYLYSGLICELPVPVVQVCCHHPTSVPFTLHLVLERDPKHILSLHRQPEMASYAAQSPFSTDNGLLSASNGIKATADPAAAADILLVGDMDDHDSDGPASSSGGDDDDAEETQPNGYVMTHLTGLRPPNLASSATGRWPGPTVGQKDGGRQQTQGEPRKTVEPALEGDRLHGQQVLCGTAGGDGEETRGQKGQRGRVTSRLGREWLLDLTDDAEEQRPAKRRQVGSRPMPSCVPPLGPAAA